MTKAVIVVILYIIHFYILKLIFLLLFDKFLGQKSLGDFMYTVINGIYYSDTINQQSVTEIGIFLCIVIYMQKNRRMFYSTVTSRLPKLSNNSQYLCEKPRCVIFAFNDDIVLHC